MVPESSIAVVGMACRFPGARDIETFWRNLVEGVESIEDLTDEELLAAGEDPSLIEHPDYVKRASALSGMPIWDAGFFGLSPKEAAIMDPQHRHFLELSWEAFESAGYAPGTFDGPVGVFGGCGAGTYMMFNILKDPDLLREQGFFLLRHIGNDKDFLATRVSYHMNLTGPALNVQTACSTSLAAIHLATQSLLSFECDAALAGGVTITHPHRRGYLYREGEILSPDGRCRAFDAHSGGTVLGDGAGAVVLRRLEDAIEDGDTVYAVIRGTAANNDGSGKVGYLAPSVDGQARVVTEALAVSGVEAGSIGYVEAHGTGTRIGDPIEVAALARAFRAGSEERTGQEGRPGHDYCGLGSVKSNIGHLDTAAGVAGFIKAVLSLHHEEIPPTLHFSEPNPELCLEDTPFRVISERTEWKRGDPQDGSTPRRAGVSSLGVGGTNVHAILEEAPVLRPTGPSRDHQLIVLSGRSRGVVGRASARLVEHLERHPDEDLADVAYTLQRGRATFGERRFLVASSIGGVVDALVTEHPRTVQDHTADEIERTAAFLFAGGGAQYPGMAAGLYRDEAVFRREMDRGLALLDHEKALQLRGILKIDDGQAPDPFEDPARRMQRPTLALPALFLVQHAQARLWMEWGIRPSAMIGHSMGEYTAACLAGVFSLDEALELVMLRAELFERVSGGAMLGVPLSETDLLPLLGGDLSVAAVNGPDLCVASGPRAAIDRLEAALGEREIETRPIHIDVAAHSAMLDPILDTFRSRLRKARMSAPSLPFVSNLTGTWITDDEAVDPEYWVAQIRQTVRFSDGLVTLLADPRRVCLEIGPGRTLATLAHIHPDRAADQEAFTSLRHPDEETEDQVRMLETLGRLWQRGVPIDWDGFYQDELRRRIALPTYPFEGDRYLVEPRTDPPTFESGPVPADEEGSATQDLASWLHAIEWVQTPRGSAEPSGGAEEILLIGSGGSATEVREVLLELPGVRRVTMALPGPAFEDLDGEFRVRLDSSDDMGRLLDAVGREGHLPPRIVYAGALDLRPADRDDRFGSDEFPAAIDRLGFFALFALGQALSARLDGDAVELIALTRGAVMTPADEDLEPAGSLVAGPVRVLPGELPGLTTRWIDLEMSGSGDMGDDRLLQEMSTTSGPTLVALRRRGRFVPRYVQSTEAADPHTSPDPERGDVSVITGGFGGLGLAVARHLARRPGARIALLSRTGLPDRAVWPEIEGSGADPRIVRAVKVVRELEADGATVLPIAADVTNEASLARARDRIRSELGEVDALFHAAGVLEDGLTPLKSPEAAERVLSPKVRGTLVLSRVFSDPTPRRRILFSSVSAGAGLAGQVDYTSANAFMDAFARAEGMTSIGWTAWSDIGMVVDPGLGMAHWPPLVTEDGAWRAPADPRFDAVDGAGGRVRVRLRSGRLWLLDEHRTGDGTPLVPGAGFLELIRAAAAEVGHSDCAGSLHLEDLYFLTPFTLPKGETREMEIRLPAPGASGQVVVAGRDRPDQAWTEHVTGRFGSVGSAQEDRAGTAGEEQIGTAGADIAPRIDMTRLRSRIPDLPSAEWGVRQDLRLGSRWDNVKVIAGSDREVLLDLELPEALRRDLDDHPLHPALLDNAMALAGPLLPGFGEAGWVYVPASFGSIRMFAPLPRKVFSHIRLSTEGETADRAEDGGLSLLDVTLFDEAGRVLVEAGQFMMVRVRIDDITRAVEEAGESREARRQALAVAAEDGMPTHVGMAILDRILDAHDPPAHVIVSPEAVDVRIEALRRRSSAGAGGWRAGGRDGLDRAARRSPAPMVNVAPVEAALHAIPAVTEAAVTAHEDRPGEYRLVAHVVMDPTQFATVSELRRSLRESLDVTQVPRNFVELERLPRDAAGAVIRDELRDPFAPLDDHVEPETPTQIAIASIWSELLGIERVSIHDNFLDVGGHSLLAMRSILKLEKVTGVRAGPVEISMLTLEQIAAFVDSRKAKDSPSESADAPETSEGSSDSTREGRRGLLAVVRRWIPGT